MMNSSGSIELLADAMSKAQLEFPTITLDKQVKYKDIFFEYASLGNIIFTLRPFLGKHGLSVMQFPSTDVDVVTVETMILHSSGQWMSSTISGRLGKNDPKELGSLITYLRRYSLGSMLACVLDGDYDAEVISQKYLANNDHKVWLRDVLKPMGIDVNAMAKVSEIMLKGNYEMTEDAVARALEVMRK